MKIRGAECTDPRCQSSRCIGPRPTTCPPGCPKQKVIHMMPEQPYRDIHAAPPPGGCLDCTRKEPEKPSYHKPRPCPPGSKPIPPKPLGGSSDIYGTETFLDTFDCQEQPWRSSSQRVQAPAHYDHSYQDIFRPSVSQGKMMGDSFGDFASAELKPWRPCSTYIPCAHDYGKPFKWRPCVRYLGDKYCKEKDWRPSVHSSAPLEGDVEKPYKSQIGVKGGAYAADTETVEGPFKPALRYIPEFYPNRPNWRPSRAHVCTKKCYHNSPKFEHIYNPVPAFETKQKLPPRNLRKDNPLFEKEHPVRSQLYDVPGHDDPPDFPPQANEEGQLLPRSGKKPIPWTTRSNPTYADGKDRTRRRIIKSGHIDHFDSSCLCVCKKRELFRPTIRILDGRQHHSVVERNVIAGPLEPGNEKLPRFRTIGPKPMAPQGTFNEDIISGRFHRYKIPKEPLTEQRAQFTTCKPWLRQEIYNDVNQAYKENRCNFTASVHPSLTRFLYEDRHAVVS
ncbi:hypothetical protein KC19_9G009500 [Ceratodon purpureus]|uniref:Uncharacterized protein n=1 Tax=Ceratodon purpureus TaxID=3225 RepID=A0A8T0GRC4_CERPU|nr:hypothetical protein KC19_9G009500 [Ceratodon purpureus]